MKIISVPMTSDAMNRLDTDSCIKGDLTELELSQAQIDRLWELGLFGALNDEFNLIIDDFEDESIELKHIEKSISIIDDYIQKNNHDDSCLYSIKVLFELANTKKTGVFFFF